MRHYPKISNLTEEQMIRAYEAIYKNILTEEELNDRPAQIKIDRVKNILSNQISPGCYAGDWFHFFKALGVITSRERMIMKWNKITKPVPEKIERVVIFTPTDKIDLRYRLVESKLVHLFSDATLRLADKYLSD